MYSSADFAGHERVMFCFDAATGLRAIVAVHQIRHGRALGGCRVYPYASEDAALRDVLRLSHGMTLKAALAGLACGGAKAVIIGDPAEVKSEAALRAFGRMVESQGGAYVTAEDVGMAAADIAVIKQETRWALGTDPRIGAASPYTALGVISAMRGALRHLRGNDSLAGLRVAVQGVGEVGSRLCGQLHEAGAQLVIADVDQAAAAATAAQFGCEVVAPEAIHGVPADIFAPCALGGTLNLTTLDALRAWLVVGAANNQLESPEIGHKLHERGITYVADYLASAGGIMSGFAELTGGAVPALYRKIEGIADTAAFVLAEAERRGIAPNDAADAVATERAAT